MLNFFAMRCVTENWNVEKQSTCVRCGQQLFWLRKQKAWFRRWCNAMHPSKLRGKPLVGRKSRNRCGWKILLAGRFGNGGRVCSTELPYWYEVKNLKVCFCCTWIPKWLVKSFDTQSTHSGFLYDHDNQHLASSILADRAPILGFFMTMTVNICHSLNISFQMTRT